MTKWWMAWVLASLAGVAYAQNPAPEEAAVTTEVSTALDAESDAEHIEGDQDPSIDEKIAEFHASLDFQTGDVQVGEGLATLDLGQSLRFLSAEDADRVLVAWGNPPDGGALGMIFPANVDPLDDNSWGVVVTYTEEGHIDDEDAADLDYDDLLEEMQSDTEDGNEARVEAGYSPIHLVGWAEPPHYDAATKKAYWAKELDFGEEDHALNYAVRVLGRKGVLELNAVAGMDQLAMIRGEMGGVIERVAFEQGHRYADFDPDMDEVAAYGVGALIAGKVAAKAGLFKGLIALLLASKKLLVAGAIGLLAVAKRFFGGRGDDTDAA